MNDISACASYRVYTIIFRNPRKIQSRITAKSCLIEKFSNARALFFFFIYIYIMRIFTLRIFTIESAIGTVWRSAPKRYICTHRNDVTLNSLFVRRFLFFFFFPLSTSNSATNMTVKLFQFHASRVSGIDTLLT